MDSKFWHEKWDSQEVGFHSDLINPLLETHWSSLALSSDAKVFVPLCGKTRDINYLVQQGHSVLGNELSELATKQFFGENQLPYNVIEEGEHQCYRSDIVTIYQGDFFTLPEEEPKTCDGFYDRASLVALPEEMRLRYVRKLVSLLSKGTKGLLITLDYPQDSFDGPPFAVPHNWISVYYGGDFHIELLSAENVLEKNQKFVDKAVPWLTESVYLLERK